MPNSRDLDFFAGLADFEFLQDTFPKPPCGPPKTPRLERKRMRQNEQRTKILDSTSGARYPRGSYGKPPSQLKRQTDEILDNKQQGLRDLQRILGLLDFCSISSEASSVDNYKADCLDKEVNSNCFTDLKSSEDIAATIFDSSSTEVSLDLPVFIAIDFEFTGVQIPQKTSVGAEVATWTSEEEQAHRKRNGWCLSCGSSKHNIRDCEMTPSRNPAWIWAPDEERNRRMLHKLCVCCGSQEHLLKDSERAPAEFGRKKETRVKRAAWVSKEEMMRRRKLKLCSRCASYKHRTRECELARAKNRAGNYDVVDSTTALAQVPAHSILSTEKNNVEKGSGNERRGFEKPSQITELGIAIFDTRDLYDDRLTNTTDLISSQHYSNKKDAKRPFRFEETIHIPEQQFATILKRLLYPEKNAQDPRQIILVGHNLEHDIFIMESLGFDQIFETFDTELLGKEVFREIMPAKLHNIVGRSGLLISDRGYHNAGNDASFTLRAMLLLATHDYDTSKLYGIQKARVEILRTIANDFSKWHEIHQSWQEIKEIKKKAGRNQIARQKDRNVQDIRDVKVSKYGYIGGKSSFPKSPP